MQKKLTERQQKVLDLLYEIAADGAVKITNDRLARDLAERKRMTGLDGKIMRGNAAGRFLYVLEKGGLIKIKQGKNTRDRIIYIQKI